METEIKQISKRGWLIPSVALGLFSFALIIGFSYLSESNKPKPCSDQDCLDQRGVCSDQAISTKCLQDKAILATAKVVESILEVYYVQVGRYPPETSMMKQYLTTDEWNSLQSSLIRLGDYSYGLNEKGQYRLVYKLSDGTSITYVGTHDTSKFYNSK